MHLVQPGGGLDTTMFVCGNTGRRNFWLVPLTASEAKALFSTAVNQLEGLQARSNVESVTGRTALRCPTLPT